MQRGEQLYKKNQLGLLQKCLYCLLKVYFSVVQTFRLCGDYCYFDYISSIGRIKT